MEPSCPVCGDLVTRKGQHGPRAIYCTAVCRNYAGHERRKATAVYAAAKARQRAERQGQRDSVRLPCQHCGSFMQGVRKDAKFCSPKCSRDGQPAGCTTPSCERPKRAKGLCNYHYRKARGEKQLWTDERRDAYHRRRAQKKSTADDRPVLLSEIRDRDGNRCHLCRKLVSAKPYPHPLSASLDHVVPLSLDGEHVPENVRLAHLRCNVAKGNGGGNEQLLLIG